MKTMTFRTKQPDDLVVDQDEVRRFFALSEAASVEMLEICVDDSDEDFTTVYRMRDNQLIWCLQQKEA